ncbi:MAG: hypothetical protein GQ574_25560 [Crocinitomix sp.]|nr:hypothetical protein [Crocinitomix sp.]
MAITYIRNLSHPKTGDNVSIQLYGNIYGLGDNEALIAHLKIRYIKRSINFLDELNGHFVLIIDDHIVKKTYVANDRFNTIPVLFYLSKNQKTIICSNKVSLINQETKTISFNLKAVFADINKDHGDYYDSYYEDIFSLKGGRYLEFDYQNKRFRSAPYWDLISSFLSNQFVNENVSKKECINTYREHLTNAVNLRKSGATDSLLLSGGLDSNSLLALLKNDKIRTYSLGNTIGLLSGELDRIYESLKLSNATHEMYTFKSDKNQISTEYWIEMVAKVENPNLSFDAYYKSIILNSLKVGDQDPNTILTGLGSDELNGGKLNTYISAQASQEKGVFNHFLDRMIRSNSALNLDKTELNLFSKSFYSREQKIKIDDPWGLYLYQVEKRGQLIEKWDESQMALNAGFYYTYPFLDKNLVDFTLTIPEKLREKLLFDKRILRKAMQASLPKVFKNYSKWSSNPTPRTKINELRKSALYGNNFALLKQVYETSSFVKENLNIDHVLSYFKNSGNEIPAGYFDVQRMINCGIIESSLKENTNSNEPVPPDSTSYKVIEYSKGSMKDVRSFLECDKLKLSFKRPVRIADDAIFSYNKDHTELYVMQENELKYMIDDSDYITLLEEIDNHHNLKQLLKHLELDKSSAQPLLQELFENGILVLED